MNWRNACRCLVPVVALTLGGPASVAAATGETCDVPLIVTQNTTVNGNLSMFGADSAIPDTCTPNAVSGVDVFYSFDATAGFEYEILVKPGLRLDVAAAVWQDCSTPESACVDGADAGGTGSEEVLNVDTKEDGTYIIQVVGVDTVSGATSVNFALKVTGTPKTPDDLGTSDVPPTDDLGTSDLPSSDDSGTTDGAIPPDDLGRADNVLPPEDTGPAIDNGHVPPTDAVVADDNGSGSVSGGCGQGTETSGGAMLLLIATFVAIGSIWRRRSVF